MPHWVLLAVLLSFVAACSVGLAADQQQPSTTPSSFQTDAQHSPPPRVRVLPRERLAPGDFTLAPGSCYTVHAFMVRRVRPQSDETRLRGESWCLESSKVKFKNLAPAGAGAGK